MSFAAEMNAQATYGALSNSMQAAVDCGDIGEGRLVLAYARDALAQYTITEEQFADIAADFLARFDV